MGFNELYNYAGWFIKARRDRRLHTYYRTYDI